MQDLGVVSVQLDKEQLMCAGGNYGRRTEMLEVRSSEAAGPQPPYLSNGYSESAQVLESCRRGSRHGKTSRCVGSQATKRMQKEVSVHQFTNDNRYIGTASPESADQERVICKFGGEEISHLTLSPFPQRMSFLELPNHKSSNTAFRDSSFGFDRSQLSVRNVSAGNSLQPESNELRGAVPLNTMQSHDLPPPSTPYVPKRRKRRKPADSSSEMVSAKVLSYADINYTDRTALPVHVNDSVKAASNVFWQNCTSKRLTLNGHCPQQFNLPVFCQYMVDNAQLKPLSYAASNSPVAVANYARLPGDRQMAAGSCTTVSRCLESLPSTTTDIENTGMASVKRNVVTAGGDHPLPLSSNVSYPCLDQSGQLCQPMVDFAQASSPKILNHFSQGTLASMYHNNPGTYASASAVTKVVESVAHCSRSVNSQACDVSMPLSTERNLSSGATTSCTMLVIKPSTPNTSSSLDCLTPELTSSETVVSRCADATGSIQCLSDPATSTVSMCCSGKSVNIVQSDTLHASRPAPDSAAVKKRKSDVVNGYHFALDCSPVEAWRTSPMLLVSSTVAQTVDEARFRLLTAANDNTRDTSAEHYSVTTPDEETSQMAVDQSHDMLVQPVNSVESNQCMPGK